MTVDPEAAEVKAAGGVVWRRGEDGSSSSSRTAPATTTGRCPRASSTRASAGRRRRCARSRRRSGCAAASARSSSRSLRRPQGPAKAVRYWLMEPEARQGVRAQRRGRRDAVAAGRGRRRRALLPPRRGARALRGGAASREPRALPRARGHGWARLDGPAGTQMVDAAIEAMDAWMRSGRSANHGGAFAAAHATDELVDVRARERRRAARRAAGRDRLRLQHDRADTRVRRRRGRTLAPGDEIVCTRLDHDANVRPWLIPAERAGATVRFAEPRPARRSSCRRAPSRRCSPSARAGWRSPRPPTPSGRSPTSPGSSPPPTRGARVYVDAVHAAPHRRLDVAALGCDALACSAYKWSARTSACSGRAPSCSRSWRPTSSSPRPTRSPTAGRPGRCRSRRWPASPPRRTTRAAGLGRRAGARAGAARRRARRARGIPGVTLHGRAPSAPPR